MKKISRRKFIQNSVLWSGAVAGTITLGLPLISRNDVLAANPEFPESQCGSQDQNIPRVLVAYASMYGTTGGVAEKIGQALCQLGYQADVRLVDNVDSISDYQAVIIGSAIRSEQWLSQAVDFVKKYRGVIRQKPTAYFLTCLTLHNNPPEQVRQKVKAFFNPVLEAVPEVQPLDFGMFAGVLDYSRMSLGMRTVMKYKMWSKDVPEGDYRPWPVIEAWSKQLAPRFNLKTT